MARNPYSPGVGTRPPYLAGREREVHRFRSTLGGYPEKRRNLRITGLRGVGKTVLLKEYERIAGEHGWVVLRQDLSPRLCDEEQFAIAITDYFRRALTQLSGSEKLKSRVAGARDAIEEISLPFGASVKLKDGGPTSILEDRLAKALIQVGQVARKKGSGVVFLFDEAHTVFDDKDKDRFPLGALLSAFVAAQDIDDDPLPVMLVLCGLPPLVGNIHDAKSNAERLFRGLDVKNLPLEPKPGNPLSEAALALVKPAEEQDGLEFEAGLAEEIARDVEGYPYFIQWFGEALWEEASLEGLDTIDKSLYQDRHAEIQESLDAEFFEPRYQDATPANQKTLRIAASLGEETFTTAALLAAGKRKPKAIDQSLRRLMQDNLIYRDDHGVYCYTAPVFGEFMRRRHPRLVDDE